MGRRALLLINRRSRSGNANRAEAQRLLTERGFEITEPTANAKPGDAIRSHAGKVELVIVGGGDGSLNAAADALAETQLPLGILPLGTANDLARTLAIPTDLEAACQVIADGHTHRIDLGRVNGHPFFNAASIGLGVAVTKRLSGRAKGCLGAPAYLFAAARAVIATRPFKVELRCDGTVHKGRTLQITVGSGKHYGGGMTLAPDATPDDARLDVHSLEVSHWLGLIPLLPALRYGGLEGSQNVKVLRGRTVEVLTRRPRKITADGEIVARTPAKFTVQPRAVTVFVPRA
jgi:YegS/Rv2252/BmrU family lipid kinase